MSSNSSRRNFLAAGLAVPAAGLSSTPNQSPSAPPARLAAPELRYRTLGRTGLKVTSLGFGCMITSDASVIERAADIGITYFDTARGYQSGNNERMVGAALKTKRKQIVLSTKSGSGTREGALNDLDTSLRELGTDFVDIWYLHAKSRPEQITDDLLEAQQTARKAGKIRFAGVSTHGGFEQLLPALAKNPAIDVILTSYNFTMEPSMDRLLDEAFAAGKGIVAMKVMAGGFRRSKPGSPLYSTLQKDGAMLSALKWALRNPKVGTTIPSMTDMDQLDENLMSMSAPFSDADKQILAHQLRFIAPLYCRMCGKCEGSCRMGLPVSEIIRYVSYAEGYGQFGLGREQYLTLPEQVASAKCDDCAGCTVSCPNGVRVAQRVSRAQELFA